MAEVGTLRRTVGSIGGGTHLRTTAVDAELVAVTFPDGGAAAEQRRATGRERRVRHRDDPAEHRSGRPGERAEQQECGVDSRQPAAAALGGDQHGDAQERRQQGHRGARRRRPGVGQPPGQ